MNADAKGGKSGEQLLKDYGIDVIVMDGFDPVSGQAYYLPAALADPSRRSGSWSIRTSTTSSTCGILRPTSRCCSRWTRWWRMEQQCEFYVKNGQPLCSRGMVDIFGRIGDRTRYDKWRAVYQENRGAESQFTVVKK